MMGAHLIDGEFQSDKYPTTPRGKVPLSVTDKAAQDLLWIYAQRHRATDAEFSADLETALRTAGFAPPADDEAEYAVVEVFGHRRHVGRILEVERFGTRMLRVDVPIEGDFEKGHTSHFYGGGSLFGVTPTDRATAERSNRPFAPAGRYLPRQEPEDNDEGEASDGEG